jgi:AraC family transcriptional regulator of adaptative response/methylated-DNA-[protein]-cysteine methyltransferase
MKPIVADTDDRRWQAVCERDTRADGQFVFAVLTTGICCRPSCRSARAAGKRALFCRRRRRRGGGIPPCKRCQPDKDYPQQQRIDKVAQACRLLEQDAPLTLEALARQLAVSPFHFHRLFKSVTGMTPKAWQQAWRARRLREALEQGKPVTRAALAAGFPDSSSYYRQADAALGMTASQFRRGGAATVVTWTTGDCALGRCLVAQSERGVCAVLPGDNDAALLDDLRQRFPAPSCVRATLSFVADGGDFRPPRRQPAAGIAAAGSAGHRVSAAGLAGAAADPGGETRSYRQVAEHIGQPRAVRAVAGACAANSLAVIVPCHRVVREDGALSGYRWGTARKAQLLAREAQRGGVMLDLFSDTPPWQEPLAPARWCCALCPRARPGAAAGDCRRRPPVAVSPDGHAGRVHHVGRHDQLRRAGLDHRSPRLPLRPGRSGNRSNLAADACRIP